MTTERFAWYAAQPPVTTAGVVLPLLCGCGQDLEDTRRAHCTRCGVLLVTPVGRSDAVLTPA